ncbi:hypothetical protein TNCV_4353251 [Trichonephila clavipes]|nr:hypothetical protein TNCV_4353251 [Trichonephila clavipes]
MREPTKKQSMEPSCLNLLTLRRVRNMIFEYIDKCTATTQKPRALESQSGYNPEAAVESSGHYPFLPNHQA